MDENQRDYYENQLAEARFEYEEISSQLLDAEDRIDKLEELLSEARASAAKAEDRYQTEVRCSMDRAKSQEEETHRALGRQARCSLFLGVLISFVFLVRGGWCDFGSGFLSVVAFLALLVASFVIALIVFVVFHLFTYGSIHQKDSHIHDIVCVVALIIGMLIAFAF